MTDSAKHIQPLFVETTNDSLGFKFLSSKVGFYCVDQILKEKQLREILWIIGKKIRQYKVNVILKTLVLFTRKFKTLDNFHNAC